MDVDIDLDYSDRISDFLRSKLNKLKNDNAQLKVCLQTRQDLAIQSREEIARNNSGSSVELGEIWKKSVNGKYVLGMEMKNNSQSALENVRATLHWTSALPLSYRFHLVSNYPNSSLDVSKSVPFARSAQVILILDVPLFADRLSYTLSGLVTFQQNDKKLTLKFPSSIQLYPHDANDNSIMVHLSAVIDGNNNDLLALALGSEEHEFVMVLPDNSTRLLESTLEIDCVLCRINLKSNRKLFLAHNICPALDGALLEAKDDSDKIVHLNLYCKNIEVVTALLHHLHKHIDGVVIVPKPLYRPDLNFTEITDLVRTSLSREFDELEKRSNTDLGKLRDGMMPLEHETDVLVVRMNQKPDS